MKVLCSACEAAEARVLCCADEAALCARCDRDVHAANRLAGKHHRLPLLPPDAVSAPNCDICQECHAYFFCVEDRALLCRSCDVAMHTANAFVSAHRRFLLTGVQVGLQPADAQQPDAQPPNASAAPLQTPPPPPPPAKKGSSPAPLYSDDDIDWAAGPDVGITGNLPDWSVVDEQFSAPVPKPPPEPVVNKPPSKRSPRGAVAAAFGGHGGITGGMQNWPLDEFFGFSEFNAGLGFTENGTSKADSGKLGSTDSSPNGRSSSDSANNNNAQDFFGQVPEFHQWSVPESPPRPRPPGSTGTRARATAAAEPPTQPRCLCQTSRPRRTPSGASPPPANRSGRPRSAGGDVNVTN
uniref:B box-type domain-containing protein n=1 Tax=Arundo donax TaxID=35708 RepID=A0A0A9CG96_ARUDO